MSNAIYELRCEHLAAPLGIDTPYPRFSWKEKTVPLACRIQCGEWDSGEFAPGNMPVAYAGTPLLPQKKYSWRVAVRTEKGWERSEEVQFETGFSPLPDGTPDGLHTTGRIFRRSSGL